MHKLAWNINIGERIKQAFAFIRVRMVKKCSGEQHLRNCISEVGFKNLEGCKHSCAANAFSNNITRNLIRYIIFSVYSCIDYNYIVKTRLLLYWRFSEIHQEVFNGSFALGYTRGSKNAKPQTVIIYRLLNNLIRTMLELWERLLSCHWNHCSKQLKGNSKLQ